MKKFTADSWAIELVRGWTAEAEEECVTIVKSDTSGALQISAYQRQAGAISRKDLLEATECDEETQGHMQEKNWGDFAGFQLVYSEDDTFWRKWWLANGRTLLFVTYNCQKSQKDEETKEINRMVCSLTAVRRSRRCT